MLRVGAVSPAAVLVAALVVGLLGTGVVVDRGRDDGVVAVPAAPTPLATASQLDTEAWEPPTVLPVRTPASLDGLRPPLSDPRPPDPPEPERPEPDAAPEAPPAPPEPEPRRGLLPPIDPEALASVAGRAGIPPRALAAYAGTALLLAEERPGCALAWSTLAAIGYVESHHGSIGGRFLDADGWPSSPIIGVALDGSGPVRAIRDTDRGRLDGDPAWDRAVGPMQFIPSTWRHHAVDADGDGVADPQQIDDSVLAAGRYLCASGGDLRQGSAWSRAILSYNRSESYLRQVHHVANHYARASHG